MIADDDYICVIYMKLTVIPYIIHYNRLFYSIIMDFNCTERKQKHLGGINCSLWANVRFAAASQPSQNCAD